MHWNIYPFVLACTANLSTENTWQVAASGDGSFANDVCVPKNVAVLIVFQIQAVKAIRIHLSFGRFDRLQCIECKFFVSFALCSLKTSAG
jgi:hypothetical protein